MCGIFAAAWWSTQPIDVNRIIAARDTMWKRGPDQAGIWYGRHAALAHRRLSIIDLSEAGRQPLSNESDTIWLTFNGEIYNFLDLKKELLMAGHRFRSSTDSEVIVHGYEEWGIEGLCSRLRGMFAFAIWDDSLQKLVLARDRVGEKPLFFLDTGGCVFAASSLNALVPFLRHKKLNDRALVSYLHLGWIPTDFSIFEGIEKVAPATYIVFDGSTRRVSEYWRLSFHRKHNRDVSDWMDDVDSTLRGAVSEQLISDVPLGCFLSGGVDSSYVSALAAELRPGLHTFSMRPDEPSYDESPYSRLVADYLGTVHTELHLDCSALEVQSELLAEFGEPFADSSSIPCFTLSRLTRQHVTVVLTGDGGDETFAGYYSPASLQWQSRFRRYFPRPIRYSSLRSLELLARLLAPSSRLSRRAHTLARVLGGDVRDAWCQRSKIEGELGNTLWGHCLMRVARDFTHVEIFRKHWMDSDAEDELGKLLYMEIKTVLPGDFLTKVDVSAMANSLETRCPFLDYRVLELAASIPSEVLFLNNQAKGLLKACAARRVPAEVIYRKKWGFGVPIFRWLDPREVDQNFQRSLAVEMGYLEKQTMLNLSTRYRQNRRRFATIVYTLWVLEKWLRRNFS